VHPIFMYGGPILVLWMLAIVPFSSTSVWLAIIHSLERLAG
jgi:hypothetical protein